MKRLESALYEPIVTYLLSQGAFAWRNNNTPIFQPVRKPDGWAGERITGHFRRQSKLTPKGLPDIDSQFNNLRVVVEVKRPGEKLSPAQESVRAEMTKRGVIWITADCLGDVMAVVENLRIEGRIA
jgi:hypothetical protein